MPHDVDEWGVGREELFGLALAVLGCIVYVAVRKGVRDGLEVHGGLRVKQESERSGEQS